MQSTYGCYWGANRWTMLFVNGHWCVHSGSFSPYVPTLFWKTNEENKNQTELNDKYHALPIFSRHYKIKWRHIIQLGFEHLQFVIICKWFGSYRMSFVVNCIMKLYLYPAKLCFFRFCFNVHNFLLSVHQVQMYCWVQYKAPMNWYVCSLRRWWWWSGGWVSER